MIFPTIPIAAVPREPVRLIGFGATAAAFIHELYSHASSPVAALLGARASYEAPDVLDAASPFEEMLVIFIVLSSDAVQQEIGEAVLLSWRAWMHGVSVIGVVVEAFESGGQAPDARARTASLFDFWQHMIDARIDIGLLRDSEQLEALRWTIGALRDACTEGVRLLSPAWDWHDVQEVLDLPGAGLTICSRQIEGEAAAPEALDMLLYEPEHWDLLRLPASGVIAILWMHRAQKLSGGDVRRVHGKLRRLFGDGVTSLVFVGYFAEKDAIAQSGATLVISAKREG